MKQHRNTKKDKTETDTEENELFSFILLLPSRGSCNCGFKKNN